MKKPNSSQRTLRWGALLFSLALTALPSLASAHRPEAWARSQFQSAEKMRAALDGQAGARSRHDYQKVIDAYRRVYYGAPTSGKADPSVSAVAELLAEMGRRFHDDALLRKAIRQYQFLRREYPGSADRFAALLAIGRIRKYDLNDPVHAKADFEEFLRRYPRHHLAEDARNELAGNKDARRDDKEQQAAGEDRDRAEGAAEKTAKHSEPVPAPTVAQAAPGPDAGPAAAPVQVTSIRHWATSDYTRIAIDLQKIVKFDAQRLDHPDRIFVDLLDTELPAALAGKTFDSDDALLKKIRVAEFSPGRTRVVLEVADVKDYKVSLASNPPQLILDIYGKHSGRQTSASVAQTGVKRTIVDADNDDDSNATNSSKTKHAVRSTVIPASERSKILTSGNIHEAQPTANGHRSLTRALGLKIGKIVIDPGHGGHDTGTIGPDGLLEKNVVLDVSLRLGKLLESRLGAEVDYTRDDDTFIPLETRTAIANRDQADLFVSIHANSSGDADARGVETYYLNFTTSRDALDVAARENAVSDQSIYELQDLVKKIALKEKIEESREFASDVQDCLHSGLAAQSPGLPDRGVRRAPFIVLIGANMPSILAEISFVSNPQDERKLRTADYRERIAESLYRGIAKYVSGLSGVRVASELDKSTRQ